MNAKHLARLHKRRGFTLIELLIAILIIGVLAAIALPAFTESLRKGRRSEAVSLLNAVVQAQERIRANRNAYITDLSQLGVQASGQHYTIAVTAASAYTYTATATANAGSPQADDSACSTMSIAMATGGALNYGASGGAPERCWSR